MNHFSQPLIMISVGLLLLIKDWIAGRELLGEPLHGGLALVCFGVVVCVRACMDMSVHLCLGWVGVKGSRTNICTLQPITLMLHCWQTLRMFSHQLDLGN